MSDSESVQSRKEMVNPPIVPKDPARFYFVDGGTMKVDAPSYVERRADRDLYEALKARKYCYLLTSRQMGKSSLTVRAARRLRGDGVAVAVIDLAKIGGNVTPEQWYFGLVSKVARDLRLKNELESYWNENRLRGLLNRWIGAFSDIVLAYCPGPIVVFVDEVDAALGLPFDAGEFFAGIRSLFTARAEDPGYDRLTFCLIGVATPSDLVRDPKITPFNIGQRIDLQDFTQDEAGLFAAGFSCSSNAANGIVRRIVHWTGGHPYLTQRLCYAVASNPAVTSKLGVDRLCKEIYFAPGARETDKTLADVSRRVLEVGIDRAGVLDLYRRIRGFRSVPDDETNPLGNTLRLSGLVVNRGGCLTVRNKIYRVIFDQAWIARNMPNAERRRQRAALLRGVVLSTTVALVVLTVISGLLIGLSTERKHLVSTAQLLKQQSAEANRQTTIAKTALAEAEDNARKADANARTADLQTVLAQQETKVVEQQSLQIKAAAVAASLSTNPAEGLRQAIEAAGESLDLFHSLLPPVAQSLKLAIDSSFERNVLRGHGGPVIRVVFAPDGKRIISGSYDGTLALWDLSGKLDKQVFIDAATNGHRITALSIAPDGKTIASGDDGSVMRIFDSDLNLLLPPVKTHTARISAIAFSPDSQLIVTVSEDKSAKLWDLKGKSVGKPIILDVPVSSVAFAQNGKLLVTGGSDGLIRLYDLSGESRLKFAAGENVPIRVLATSPDGDLIASTSDERTLRLWDLQGKPVGPPFEGHTSSITSVLFSPDGRRIASGSLDKSIKIWNLDGRVLYELRGHQDPVNSVAFSPDGRLIVSAAGDTRYVRENTKDYTIRLWDAGIEPVAETRTEDNEELYSVALNTKWGLVASGGRRAHLYSAGLHPVGRRFEEARQMASAVTFSPDGKLFANGGIDGIIRISDLKGNAIADPIKAHAGAVSAIAFTSDGSMIASGGSDGSVRFWSLKGDSVGEITHVSKSPILNISFSPKGGQLAILARGEQLRVYEYVRNANLRTQALASEPAMDDLNDSQVVEFSPHGQLIVTAGSSNGELQIWKLANRTVTYQGKLSGNTAPVTAIAFSPDGNTLASTSNDGTLRFWGLEDLRWGLTRRDLGADHMLGAPYIAHEREIDGVEYSPDGKTVTTAGRDGAVRSWNAQWTQWLIVACNRMRFHPLLQSGAAQSACRRYAWKIAKPLRSDSLADRIWKGDLDAINDLIKMGTDVNAPDLGGRPPLSIAIWTGRADVAEVLLSAGAKINSRDLDGDTPLSYAVLSADSKLVAFLIELGADVNIPNARGETPLAKAESADLGHIENQLIEAGAKVEKPFGVPSQIGDYHPVLEEYVPKDLDAQTALGCSYEIGKGVEQSFDQAMAHFSIAAKQGSAYAQFRIGRLAYYGKGTPQSFTEAARWYKESARQGNSWGQNNLGFLYERGEGVAKDSQMAFALMRMSAQQNNPFAQRNIARYFLNGIGTKKDMTAALASYRVLAENGDVSAQFVLADLLECMREGRTADEEAAKWFRASAEQGNIAAKQRLGWMFETGRGVPQSVEEALKLYKEAADAGNSVAQVALGWLYENGLYIEKNGTEAFRWYEIAAKAGNWQAMIGVGRLYENGFGVPKSQAEAIKWYKRCADAGSDEAKSILAHFELAENPNPHN